MPHIHAQPGQHDMTVSAYILLREENEWKCMVHFHWKIEKLMQIGGHIELDETPWQAMAHEIEEESGFTLGELQLLQPSADMPIGSGFIGHPVPFSANTHNVGDEHYHSDSCYGFVANARPRKGSGEGESDDLRWLPIEELRVLADGGNALRDVVNIYEFLITHINAYVSVPAVKFSLDKPKNAGISYRRGKPSEHRS